MTTQNKCFIIGGVMDMATIIDGKELAKTIRAELKQEVEMLQEQHIQPKLAVILVGNDKASQIYVRNKNRACEELGIAFEEFLLEENTTMETLLEIIQTLNRRKDIHGILLQSPIPKHLNMQQAIHAMVPEKDVDGFHPVNVGKLMIGEDAFVSCTPQGVVQMLETYNIPIEGKHVVIIGRSNIVGKPLIPCLLNKHATVTVCHSKTPNVAEMTKQADIVIAAVGKAKFVTADMIKPGAAVIDVGINRNAEGKIEGDVDFENVSQKASHITPVPGGVGPMTIAMLMHNVVKAAKLQNPS